jgi:hypothetical protein
MSDDATIGARVPGAVEHSPPANGNALHVEAVPDAMPDVQLATIQAADPEKVRRVNGILDLMGDARTDYNIVHRDNEFILVGSFTINGDTRVEGEVCRAATLDAMLNRVIESDGHRLGPLPANENQLPAEMTLEAIKRDPENAVTLDIPENASVELLSVIVDTAARLRENAEGYLSRAVSIEEEAYWDREYAQADQRIEEAERQRDDALLSHDMAREDVRSNPSAVVDKDIPRTADSDFLAMARDTASYAREAARSFGSDVIDLMSAALSSFFEPEPEIRREGPSGAFLPPLRSASVGAEHGARVADLIVGALVGYFVDEPTLTPQQVHDTTRANAERDESRAVDAAKWDNAAALDAVNIQINHNRSPVHAGAGDEPSRAETIYDRYPGLTRDDSGERERENDRAFYDTGIERSR